VILKVAKDHDNIIFVLQFRKQTFKFRVYTMEIFQFSRPRYERRSQNFNKVVKQMCFAIHMCNFHDCKVFYIQMMNKKISKFYKVLFFIKNDHIVIVTTFKWPVLLTKYTLKYIQRGIILRFFWNNLFKIWVFIDIFACSVYLKSIWNKFCK
jgi:hypothetical protein